MQAEQEAMKAAVKGAEQVKQSGKDGTVTLSNGIVLKIKAVPPLLVYQAQLQLRKPKPPVTLNEDKGREEENPLDPDYLQDLDEYVNALGLTQSNVIFLLGTKPLTIPEGYYGPKEDGWLEPLAFFKIDVGEGENARYLSWLRYYALSSEEDITLVMSSISAFSGVKREAVEQAAESFRPPVEPDADNGSPPEVGDNDGSDVSG